MTSINMLKKATLFLILSLLGHHIKAQYPGGVEDREAWFVTKPVTSGIFNLTICYIYSTNVADNFTT